MSRIRHWVVMTVMGMTLFSGFAAKASPEGSDTVSPAESKVILDYFRKYCTDPRYYDSCIPGGVDLDKNEVRVLDRDISLRNEEVDAMQNQTVADVIMPIGHNDYAQYLKQCKPPTPLKYSVDIAVYKMRGSHAREVAMQVTENIWRSCDTNTPENAAALRFFQKIKLIHIAFAPPSAALEQDVDYSFDAKTGTLTVKAFAKTPLPLQSSINANWKRLLKNN